MSIKGIQIVSGLMRILINSQRYLSKAFDSLLDGRYSVDGNTDFAALFVPKYLKPCLKIYDIGGGKSPYIDPEMKSRLKLSVIGLDIDQDELHQAPKGAYDELIYSDITNYEGKQDADLVICRAVLEHVKDVEKAFAAIASILKPGGKALIFVPSKNALFARLNLMLPQKLKKILLHTIFPHTHLKQGFPSYYDRCTPRQFQMLGRSYGLQVDEKRLYFISSYFSFFFPAYFMWRLWILMFHFLAGEQAAETFSIALRKSSGPV